MKWDVKGADRETGRDVRIEVEADDEAAAVKTAGRTMLVESARPLPMLTYATPPGRPPPRPRPMAAPEPSVPAIIEPLPVAAAASPAPPPALPRPWRETGSINSRLAVSLAFYLVGTLLILSGSFWTEPVPDFHTDNAVGAAANELHLLNVRIQHYAEGIGGLLCLIFGALLDVVAYHLRTRHYLRTWLGKEFRP